MKRTIMKILKGIGITLGSLLVILVLAMALFGGFDLILLGVFPEDEDMTRTEAENYLASLEAVVEKDENQRLEIGYYQYFIGEFDKAKETFQALIEEGSTSFNAFSMLSEIYYLQGRYDEAETIMRDQMEKHPMNINVQLKAQIRLIKVYYQTNQFQKAADLSLPSLLGMGGFKDWMLSFDQIPYQMNWPEEGYAVVPMISVDPLPILALTIQGEEYYFMVDTGGDALIIDHRLEDLYGEIEDSMDGSFGGGMESSLGFTKLESVGFNGLVIENVPAMALDISHFDALATPESTKALGLPEDFQLTGIIGTKIFQQALVTMDYINGEVILRDPNIYSGETVLAESQQTVLESFDFWLSELNTLTAKGKLMGESVMYWLDSGYASENAVLADTLTFKDFGIELPKLSYNEEAISGGGTGYAEGNLEDYGSAGIGTEIMDGAGIGYDPGEIMYWDVDYIVEGMLSHAYLRNYAWTIDFQAGKMYLSR